MLRGKTVFIVGAGASHEVGLPVGSLLKEQIVKRLVPKIYDRNSTGYSGEMTTAFQLYQSRVPGPSSCWQAAAQIVSGLPIASSIDNFLNTHKNNPAMIYVGKVAIALCILDAEAKSLLYFDRSKTDCISQEGIKNTWYARLGEMLFSNVLLENVEEVFDKVSFIYFNYDRCIEQYLLDALQAHFSISDTVAKNILTKSLNIIHPYGYLGALWDENNGLKVVYGSPTIRQTASILAEGIRTFTEQIEDRSLLNKISQEIQSAQSMLFLGFGYHRINMQLLRAVPVNTCGCFGTSMGLSAEDIEDIIPVLSAYTGTKGEGPRFYPKSCGQTLYEITRKLV